MPPLSILVTGASGTVGTELVPALAAAGHGVTLLVRRPPRPGSAEIQWDPTGAPNAALFEGSDAVIHLAGESIASSNWTEDKKARILNSRVQGTATLAASLARMAKPPRVVIAASAIGYYGNRGDELLVEESTSGTGFLAEVCRQWEAALAPAVKAGIRVVNLRLGMVLSARGGALKKMLTPFKLGAGGRLGSGRQWISWISIADVVGAIQFILANDALRGPVNAVSPQPVSNAEFTRALGRALHRPTLFPMPAFLVRLVFGQLGEELLLASQKVEPARLQAAGFPYRHSEIGACLRELLRSDV
ncbi:MAG TPA: TIGR01777 family oxidoreductase [Terriglobales bacterium]|nr:TIGR01777 family oxidoreductase [Terriglobales bacterium]